MPTCVRQCAVRKMLDVTNVHALGIIQDHPFILTILRLKTPYLNAARTAQ